MRHYYSNGWWFSGKQFVRYCTPSNGRLELVARYYAIGTHPRHGKCFKGVVLVHFSAFSRGKVGRSSELLRACVGQRSYTHNDRSGHWKYFSSSRRHDRVVQRWQMNRNIFREAGREKAPQLSPCAPSSFHPPPINVTLLQEQTRLQRDPTPCCLLQRNRLQAIKAAVLQLSSPSRCTPFPHPTTLLITPTSQAAEIRTVCQPRQRNTKTHGPPLGLIINLRPRLSYSLRFPTQNHFICP
jgi:hypothetical protein